MCTSPPKLPTTPRQGLKGADFRELRQARDRGLEREISSMAREFFGDQRLARSNCEFERDDERVLQRGTGANHAECNSPSAEQSVARYRYMVTPIATHSLDPVGVAFGVGIVVAKNAVSLPLLLGE